MCCKSVAVGVKGVANVLRITNMQHYSRLVGGFAMSFAMPIRCIFR